jgi:hypothetical protein
VQGIFISYRRQDSQSAAGRMADDVREQLPDAQIFRDVETIEAGVDFVQAIDTALESCAVMLAVIGPHWISVTDSAGQRRLDDPDDFTRLEIATALARSDVRVIPVLVDGAQMPAAAQLPDDLKTLARRNAIELTDKRWEYDVSQLVQTLRRTLGLGGRPARARGRWIAAAVAGASLVAVLGYSMSGKDDVVAPPPAPIALTTPVAPAVVTPPRPEPSPPTPAPIRVDEPAPVALAASASDPCPATLSINRELPTPFSCRCDADSWRRGAVWGSDTYTDDSGLCRAARHAGVLARSGGSITVVRASGQALYAGSSRNGITSSDYGAYSHSIRFVGAPPPASVASVARCPLSLSSDRNLPDPYTCFCDSAAIQSGSVWGTERYTDDSGLCRAARHAGVIAPDGGTLTVRRSPGRAQYGGSLRNGVQSSDYGSYAYSMQFAATPKHAPSVRTTPEEIVRDLRG